MRGFLNQDSINRIKNIELGFKNYPAYSAYEIHNYIYILCDGDGVHALEITKNGSTINLLLFYPDPSGSGKIGSIAMYGASLQEHYNAMNRTMTAFGMPISYITFDSGKETFLDIYLDY